MYFDIFYVPFEGLFLARHVYVHHKDNGCVAVSFCPQSRASAEG